MGQTNSIVSLLILAAIVALLCRRPMLGALIDGITEIANHFRGGGPRTPMHPSPADDGALLRRRSWLRAVNAKKKD
jgi:hypothetical protein